MSVNVQRITTSESLHQRKHKIITVKKSVPQYRASQGKTKWHGIEGGTVFGGPVLRGLTVHEKNGEKNSGTVFGGTRYSGVGIGGSTVYMSLLYILYLTQSLPSRSPVNWDCTKSPKIAFYSQTWHSRHNKEVWRRESLGKFRTNKSFGITERHTKNL